MGADSTLVKSAFTYGESLAGADVPDMSTLTEGQREISKTYVSGVLDIFKSLREDEEKLDNARDAQLRAFKVAAAKAKKHLLDNEQAQPMKVHNAIYDKFKSLEQEFMLYNTVEDNDNEENEKMRANLYAQLSIISNQAVEARGTIATKATMADFIVGDGGPEQIQNIAIGRAIMGVDGDYEHIELFFNKDGHLTYLVQLPGMDKAVEWTIEDFNKNIIIHDVNIDAYAQKAQNAAYKRGLETKQDFNYDELKSSYLKTVIKNDEQIFRDIAFSEINGKKSWKKSLLENPEIATASIEYLFTEDMIGKLGLADVDGIGGVTFADMDRDGDNKITSADLNNLSDDAKLLWKQNIQLITDALTNVKNPAFDFGKSADALADYFVSGLKKDYFDDGRSHQKPQGNDKDAAKIYTIGDSTYQFEYPASGAVEKRQRATVIRALEGRDKIFIWQGEQKPSIEFKKVEGGYQEQGNPGDWGYKDEERTDPYPQPDVISLDDFILQYGGSQQPILTSGSGYNKQPVIIPGLEAKDPKDMTTKELGMKMKNNTASEEERLEWMRRIGKNLEK